MIQLNIHLLDHIHLHMIHLLLLCCCCCCCCCCYCWICSIIIKIITSRPISPANGSHHDDPYLSSWSSPPIHVLHQLDHIHRDPHPHQLDHILMIHVIQPLEHFLIHVIHQLDHPINIMIKSIIIIIIIWMIMMLYCVVLLCCYVVAVLLLLWVVVMVLCFDSFLCVCVCVVLLLLLLQFCGVEPATCGWTIALQLSYVSLC